MPDRPGLKLARIVLDTTDVERAARFWSRALGYKVAHKSEEFWSLRHPTDTRAARIGLQPTDERKPADAVNAVHLEVFTDDMEREAKRLEKLGATRAEGWPYPDEEGLNWIVMRDPDGHEFCVVQPR